MPLCLIKGIQNPSCVPIMSDKLEQCLHSSCTQQLTCVRAGPPQGWVSLDKAQGSPLHQERTFGLPLVAQAQ
jgi:hypothetical protein